MSYFTLRVIVILMETIKDLYISAYSGPGAIPPPGVIPNDGPQGPLLDSGAVLRTGIKHTSHLQIHDLIIAGMMRDFVGCGQPDQVVAIKY